jgi:hypothetical protein
VKQLLTQPGANKLSDNATSRRGVGLMAFLLAVFLVFACSRMMATATGFEPRPEPQKRGPTRRPTRKPTAQKPRVNYSSFSHRTHVEKQKLACDSCHKFPTKNWKEVRKGDAAIPDVADFPEHASCLNCHREQFFARERPAPVICSNCHVAVSPRDTTRFLFPSLGDVTDAAKKRRDFVSEFQVNFPHDKHVDLVGENRPRYNPDRSVQFVRAALQDKAKEQESQPKSCPVCHQTYQPQGDSPEEYVTKPPKTLGDAFWLKKGTFKTIPASHTTCFTCHTTDSGINPLPTECNLCHKLLPANQKTDVDFDSQLAATMGITDRVMLGRWRRRESSGTFPHEGGLHPTLICTACHNIATMNTVEPKTLKVAVKSCGGAEGCHVTATTDEGGALNFEIDQRKTKPDFQCTKCHLRFGGQSVPANHFEAIPVKKS